MLADLKLDPLKLLKDMIQDSAGISDALDLLKPLKDMIQDSAGISDANDRRFTLEYGDGHRFVSLPDGLTPEFYGAVAPLISAPEQLILACGVLKKLAGPTSDWEINDAWRRLRQKVGSEESNWLTQGIDKFGFDVIADLLKKELEAIRKLPPPKLYVAVHRQPTWVASTGLLWLGELHWRFRRQHGPVKQLLDALEGNNWPFSVLLKHLDPDQVREAARILRKTRPQIEWKAALDGTLSWFVA